MKDIKSYVIGFLTCACLFLIMGQTEKEDFEIFDTIVAKSIGILGEDGKAVTLWNKDGIGMSKDGTEGFKLWIDTNGIIINNDKGKKVMTLQSLGDGNGSVIATFNGDSDEAQASMYTQETNSGIRISNLHDKNVVNIGANKNEDGAILLFDRYGDIGWIQTGKQ